MTKRYTLCRGFWYKDLVKSVKQPKVGWSGSGSITNGCLQLKQKGFLNSLQKGKPAILPSKEWHFKRMEYLTYQGDSSELVLDSAWISLVGLPAQFCSPGILRVVGQARVLIKVDKETRLKFEQKVRDTVWKPNTGSSPPSTKIKLQELLFYNVPF